MNPAVVFAAVAIATISASRASGAQLNTGVNGGELLVQFQGDANDDWRLQGSVDLTNWNTLTNFGVLLSGQATNAPWRRVGLFSEAHQFYRGLKSSGLFDPSVFHTVNLTFTQANWSTLLANAHSSGINVYCSLLTLDNGATNMGVGARYKGHTSYSRAGLTRGPRLATAH